MFHVVGRMNKGIWQKREDAPITSRCLVFDQFKGTFSLREKF